jgi:hypothetical protein
MKQDIAKTHSKDEKEMCGYASGKLLWLPNVFHFGLNEYYNMMLLDYQNRFYN